MKTAIQPAQPLHPPSSWIQRWHHLAAPGGRVLDVACGPGRHLYWLHAQGHPVTGVDRSPEAIASTLPLAQAGARIVQADIENGPWPFEDERFDLVVVTNYLWRPLLPTLRNSLADGGVLLYETFASGNETVGKPSRPDFLLQPGELLQAFTGLHVVAYEDGFCDRPERFVQRLAAVRKRPGTPAPPPRFRLDTAG
ncbi:class I SAM-dependent methyltransferase [Hydrogenophaga sp. BPS33]|nr:class I SAM-dependent methyltransferase [Hydrogenophaga sp. BPS33]